MEHSSLIVGAAEVVGGGTMDGWGGMGLGRYGEGPAIAIIIQVTRGIDQRPANWPVSAAIPAIWNLEKGKRSKWSCATISVSNKKGLHRPHYRVVNNVPEVADKTEQTC